jgi:DivIVA domain-containing protein
VDGDEVRGTRFARGRTEGYDAAEVNDLLGRVAAELDAGRSAGPLIENATFRRKSFTATGQSWDSRHGATSRRLFGLPIPTPSQYDIDAVDWFLDQLSPPTGGTERADIGADPWRDLAVAQLAQRGTGTSAGATTIARKRSVFANVLKYAEQLRALDRQFTQECYSAWQQFGRQPGVFLQEGKATGGRWWARRHELRTYARQTAGQQVIASRDSGLKSQTLRVGGRNFTYRKVRGWLGAIPHGLAVEIAARSARDSAGHFTAEAISSEDQQAQNRMIYELVDEAGMPILYTSGGNFDRRACACVTFADQRWLRFLVRGTMLENAIMTAVDQAGNKVARYRQSAEDFDLYREWGEVIITVHPDRELTDELVAAIALSAGWLESYFSSPAPAPGTSPATP